MRLIQRIEKILIIGVSLVSAIATLQPNVAYGCVPVMTSLNGQ